MTVASSSRNAERLRFIPNCGHAPMLEQPVVFADLVAEFLESLGTVPVGVA